MTHKRAYAIAALLYALLCSSASAIEVRFGSAQLDWPDGYKVTSTQSPFELTGPSGEKVLVTIMRPGKEPTPESAASEQERLAIGIEGHLRTQASKVGRVTLPLQRSPLPDGSLLLHIGSETSSLFFSGFFLQYIVVSPTGRLAYFTAEGKGAVDEQHGRFLPVVSTLRWVP